jgi:hypothetical protein
VPDLSRSTVDVARELLGTAAAASWRGPDPYDGLLHRWPAALRGGPRRRQLIVQLHARAPFDVRRLYRRSEQPRISKALALFGQTALRLDMLGADPSVLEWGRQALALLASDDSAGAAWGYPFDVQTRWSFYPAGAPNVIATAFAARALSEAGRQLEEERFQRRACEAARWTLERVFDPRTGVFSYHEHSDAVIHNANLLAARLVWSQLADDPAARCAVARAVERSLSGQSPDGAWRYGEGPGLEWNDSFHTGFVLGALADLTAVDDSVRDALARGADAYVGRFFGPRGEARLWPDRSYPEDGHAAGTGLSTLVSLHGLGLVEPATIARLAGRVISAMVIDGHAVWRRTRWGATRIPYIRWCDAHVALGLADAAGLELDAESAPGRELRVASGGAPRVSSSR